MVELKAIELVKWSDGKKTGNKQRELEILAADLADGGGVLCCAGRSGGGNIDSDGTGGCAASQTGGSTGSTGSPGGSGAERDARLTRKAQSGRGGAERGGRDSDGK